MVNEGKGGRKEGVKEHLNKLMLTGMILVTCRDTGEGGGGLLFPSL